MLRNRKIAVFIDVDNTEMDFSQYKNAMEQICSMGEVVCATVYGASERKQKGVIDDAKQKGYSIQLPARTRRRVRKVFDDRIWVDVTDLVAHNTNINTVAIVAYPTDMVYLFSYLRRLGLQVVGSGSLDEASLALVSDIVDICVKSDANNTETDSVCEKLQESSEVTEEIVASTDNRAYGFEDENRPETEKYGESDAAAAETTYDLENSEQSEIEAIAEMHRAEAEKTPAAAIAADDAMSFSESAATESASEDSSDGGDLVDKIDRISKSGRYDYEDDLVSEIKKLLDGLD